MDTESSNKFHDFYQDAEDFFRAEIWFISKVAGRTYTQQDVQILSLVILYCLHLESLLNVILKIHIGKNDDDPIVNKLLRFNFSDKIKLCFDLGKITEKERDFMNEIREIRNRFVHLKDAVFEYKGENILVPTGFKKLRTDYMKLQSSIFHNVTKIPILKK